MSAEDVRKQAEKNAADAARQRTEIKRRDMMRATAKTLREKTKEAERANAETRKAIGEFKEVTQADLLELEAKHAATVAEGKELAAKLSALRKLTGVV